MKKKAVEEEEEDPYKEPGDEMLEDRKRAWLLTKSEIRPLVKRNKEKYPEHDRAQQVYAQYISGYAIEEIAQYFEIQADEVRRDVQHIQTALPTKSIIAHNNDRKRIMIQRTQGDAYEALLSQSLAIEAREYLKAGVSPVAPMKEYREAVGMTEKPGAFSLHLTQTSAQIQVNSGGGMRSAEDVLRKAMEHLDEPEAVDIEAKETVQLEQIEEPDEMVESED